MFYIHWLVMNTPVLEYLTIVLVVIIPLQWSSRLLSTLFHARSISFYIIHCLNVVTVLFLYKINLLGWVFGQEYMLRVEIRTLYYLNYITPINLAISLDNTSIPFFLVTLLLGGAAIVFSHFYMEGEVYKTRFIQLLTAFLLSMLLLLASGNLITLFLGWELIGLFSFLLINFWTIKPTSLKSANKALAYNQLSDAFFMGAIIGFGYLGVDIPSSAAHTSCGVNTLATISLVGCICCKSAQFPFHFWLPDSMEAPIPASALIHSATLVSAGVYLILRLAPYHQYSYTLVYPLTILSLITICVGGLASCVQNDLKKILAYSTISNCGFMVLFAASNKESLCFLYFTLHGIFKAAAFFIIGTIVIVSKHKQDWRYANLPAIHRKPLLLILLPTIALLGAWPGSITGIVKHMNVDLVTHPYLVVPTQWITHVGTATSIIYSVKIVTLLLQYENIKQINEATPGTHVEQQLLQIGILILLGTFISFCGLEQVDLASLYTKTKHIEFKNVTSGLISFSLLPLLLLSYCFWSRKKNQVAIYAAVLIMLVVQML